jgi:hypothetical protein
MTEVVMRYNTKTIDGKHSYDFEYRLAETL